MNILAQKSKKYTMVIFNADFWNSFFEEAGEPTRIPNIGSKKIML